MTQRLASGWQCGNVEKVSFPVVGLMLRTKLPLAVAT